MKTAVCTHYGPPEAVEIRETPKPSIEPDKILIRVHATCVNSGDSRIRSLNVPFGMGLFVRCMFGFFAPRIDVYGNEAAGVVEEVGANIDAWRVGDEVIATTGMELGGHAEFLALAGRGSVVKKPERLSMIEAASIVFGGLTALHFLRHEARLAPGERILVNGATGAVGCASIQLAKHLGAHVTAVCSAHSAALARSLGADAVIDYAVEDLTRGAARFDVVMNNVGNVSWRRCEPLLTAKGRYIGVASGLGEMALAPLVSRKNGKRLIVGVAKDTTERLSELRALAEAGVFRPVIDRVLPFDEIVAAHRRVDSGRKQGAVVLSLV